MIDRRRFLAGAGATALLPRLAWAEPTREDVARVQGGLDHARTVGKPLLVFVVPEDPAERWKQGGAFADLLLLADDELMCLLALAEPLCATEAAVEGVTKPWATVRGPKQFEIVETDPRIDPQPIAAWTLARPWVPYGYEGAELPKGQANRESNLRRMSQSLRAIAATPERLALRAGQVAEAVPERDRKRLWKRIVAGKDVEPADVWRCAPVLLVDAQGEVRPRVVALIAASARARLVDRGPPGGRWVMPSVAPDDFRPGPQGDVPYLVFDV